MAARRGGQGTAEQHGARLMAAQALGEDADSKRALLQVASLLAAERAAVAAARRVARAARRPPVIGPGAAVIGGRCAARPPRGLGGRVAWFWWVGLGWYNPPDALRVHT